MVETRDKSVNGSPTRTVEVGCICGVRNKVVIPAEMQPLEVTYSSGPKSSQKVNFKCGETDNSKGGCKRNMTCILCQGSRSGSFSHPLERFLVRGGGWSWPGTVLFSILLCILFYFIYIPTVDSRLWTVGIPNRVIISYFIFTIAAPMIFIGFAWYYRQLKMQYGKIERHIPEEYKFHVDESFSFFFSSGFYAISLLVTALLFVLTSSGARGNGTVIGSVVTYVFNGIALFGFFIQFAMGLVIFTSALALKKYKRRAADDVQELKDAVKGLYISSYIFFVIIALSNFIGMYTPVLFGSMDDGPGIRNYNFLIQPLGIVSIGSICILFLSSSVFRAIDRWTLSTEHTGEHMVLEVFPTGEGSMVHVETTHPRLDGRADVNSGAAMKGFNDEVNTLVSVASLVGTRGVSNAERSPSESDESFIFQEKFRNLGERLSHEFIRDSAFEAFVSGLAGDEDLTVIIRASGKEAALPWELLHYRGDFLALRTNVVRTNRALDLIKDRRINIDNVLIVANDARSTKLKDVAPLDKIDGEIDAMQIVLKGTVGVTVLKNEKATKEEVLKALRSGRYQALHFSGHSFFNRENPLYSNLLLYNDERLTAYDLKTVTSPDTNLQLVFLNSCHSGSAASLARHELHGLADALVARGIPYVIGMQWEVTDNGSADFSNSFYSAITKGSSPEEAVRLARKFVAEKYNFKDPIWAAPILYRA